MQKPDTSEFSGLLQEHRRFPPPAAFAASANVSDPSIYERANQDPEQFWATWAEELIWERRWDRVLDWHPPHARWFVGGQLNACVNCVDRHLAEGYGDRHAIVWEGEGGATRRWTYSELSHEVARVANALRGLGVRKGDRVAIYLPMIPELIAVVLACARIGSVHIVVFAGFSATSLRDRMNDAGAKLLVTADAGYRRGECLDLGRIAREASKGVDSLEHVIVLGRRADDAAFTGPAGWRSYRELVSAASHEAAAEPMDSGDPLFVLYTSGTTGKPKGIVHGTGGYLTGVYATTRMVLDLKREDVYWCTADVGWITGHSYLVYGPLMTGATLLLYEGAVDWPVKDRIWALIEKHRVSVLYTAPTLIRACMKTGDEWPRRNDLSSLRLIGSVGEPINPEAWMWYYRVIGGGRCPLVDTWWQTETGAIMVASLPGLSMMKPGSAGHPIPGISVGVLNEDGVPIGTAAGLLVVDRPWPSMLIAVYNDPQRYVHQYWSRFGGSVYETGDSARRDGEGDLWLLGRVDDVINVSGHRIGTMEIESAIVDHPSVAEAAVVGRPHAIKGQAIAAFVILKDGQLPSAGQATAVKSHVTELIGAIARPEEVVFVPDLPKTRSGKIMRRLLRRIAGDLTIDPTIDVSTLADRTVVDRIASAYRDSVEESPR